MKKSFLLSLFLLVSLSGCGWLALMDTNPDDDASPSFEQWVREQTGMVRNNVLGKTKDEVLQLIGDPDYKNLSDEPERFFPRNSWRVYGVDEICDERECGPLHYDEIWQYPLERRQNGRFDSSGYTLFFYQGRVIGVDCG